MVSPEEEEELQRRIEALSRGESPGRSTLPAVATAATAGGTGGSGAVDIFALGNFATSDADLAAYKAEREAAGNDEQSSEERIEWLRARGVTVDMPEDRQPQPGQLPAVATAARRRQQQAFALGNFTPVAPSGGQEATTANAAAAQSAQERLAQAQADELQQRLEALEK